MLALLGQHFERDVSGDPARRAAFRRMLGSERGFVTVAEEGRQVLGLISVSINLAIRFDVAYAQIEELVVDSEARGKQAGALLVRAPMGEARQRGCRIRAREARAFYEKLGFA